MRLWSASLFAIISLAATACVSTHTVVGPDGTTWYQSTCGAHFYSVCATEAARNCPDGYIVGADASGAPIYQCADDYVANRVPQQSSAMAAPWQQSAMAAPPGHGWLPSDVFVCDHVRSQFAAAASNWARAHGGVARSSQPARDAFLEACVPLDQEAQGCLYPQYYEGHRAACDRTMSALPASAKQQLDAVFEEPSPAKPAASALPAGV
jgi:hypothetical protein